MFGKTMHGKYKPVNPQKYRGNPNDIVYRSSWELTAFRFCDNTDGVVAWASEETVIPYRCGTDGLMHRYFVDLCVWTKQQDGTVKKFLIEIKPKAQVLKPKKTAKKKEETYLTEVKTWVKNQSKWKAAREWCKGNNAEFMIWTEDVLAPQGLSYNKAIKKPKVYK